MSLCNRMHYPGNDPEDGPAGPCILDKGHAGDHQQREEEWEHDPDCVDNNCFDCSYTKWEIQLVKESISKEMCPESIKELENQLEMLEEYFEDIKEES